MDSRRPTYEELATISIDVGDRSVAKIVKELVTRIQT